MAEASGLRRLSLSETRVARLVAAGLSDEQIAVGLGIAVVDVSAELAEIFRKLGIDSRTELALLVPETVEEASHGSRAGDGPRADGRRETRRRRS